MPPLPEPLSQFRMFGGNSFLDLFSVFFHPFRQRLLIFSGYIDDFFQMFFQVLHPLILIKFLHIRQSSEEQIIKIAAFF